MTMPIAVEDLEKPDKYRKILEIQYTDLARFVFDYLKRKSSLIISFWVLCLAFLVMSVSIRFEISGYFRHIQLLSHSMLGLLIFPLLIIPVHELLHIIPFYLSGAKNIRVGMDLRQYLFYVTAHRHVASPLQFKIVAVLPFAIISVLALVLINYLPGLWKWSLSLFLFVHATMCSGDFALLNFYFLNRDKKIYTWDDAEKKIAYFYEEVNNKNLNS